ncbi:hypothetical protein RFI_16809 [Reticulomyxa filosa]|uniref:Uncharacterized protein n=1 Tax=Reticulomyxa filosa TaxID=46433 RepID=X6N2D0_RETFI|nr:hypothetical protein RFI_16809 [Reticulomyxa filosa]|eukprot:ETO20405.1 hypothetical protein RFI_16809 [Reticulomyxa filosa]
MRHYFHALHQMLLSFVKLKIIVESVASKTRKDIVRIEHEPTLTELQNERKVLESFGLDVFSILGNDFSYESGVLEVCDEETGLHIGVCARLKSYEETSLASASVDKVREVYTDGVCIALERFSNGNVLYPLNHECDIISIILKRVTWKNFGIKVKNSTCFRQSSNSHKALLNATTYSDFTFTLCLSIFLKGSQIHYGDMRKISVKFTNDKNQELLLFCIEHTLEKLKEKCPNFLETKNERRTRLLYEKRIPQISKSIANLIQKSDDPAFRAITLTKLNCSEEMLEKTINEKLTNIASLNYTTKAEKKSTEATTPEPMNID